MQQSRPLVDQAQPDKLTPALKQMFAALFSPTAPGPETTLFDNGVESHKHLTRVYLEKRYPYAIPWVFS